MAVATAPGRAMLFGLAMRTISLPPPPDHRIGVRVNGSARVCCDPLIAARSGNSAVASAWKGMFDVPEIMIAASGGFGRVDCLRWS